MLKKILKFSFLLILVFYFSQAFNKALAANYKCNGLKEDIKALCESIKGIDCDKIMDKEKREECESADKKVGDYLKSLKINNKTQNLLAGQLNYINQQQIKNQLNLQQIKNQLDEITRKINNLKENIIEKEKEIAYQKKILTSLMQSYYDYDQQGLLEIVLVDKTISSSLSQVDYIQQSEVKVEDVLNSFQNTKQQLTEAKEELKKDYDKNKQLEAEYQYEKSNLQASENQKQYLLVKTQGQEEKYKAMLANIEKQKKELLDFSAASNIDDVLASVNKYDKPDKKYWASDWYFSQRDSRWGDEKIGNSHSLMKNYGCAITSVSMVFRKLGSNIDPGKIAKEKIFYYDLIEWPDSWEPKIKLVSSTAHGNINWSTVSAQIKKGHPVIVHILRNGGGHYVVIHHYDKKKKDYVVNDPYFGANLYLGTSRSLIGKLGTNSRTLIDQMIIYN
ncbi:MAG TPA: hypothetical protein ENL05_00210 [Candidatus Moranbacteria bacterium]|nr:hypothetical protein [Candidatus Moranbacteria bacterium]